MSQRQSCASSQRFASSKRIRAKCSGSKSMGQNVFLPKNLYSGQITQFGRKKILEKNRTNAPGWSYDENSKNLAPMIHAEN